MKQPEKYPAHSELKRFSILGNGHKVSIDVSEINDLQREFSALLTDRQADEKLIRELLGIVSHVDYVLRNIWALDRKKFEAEILPRTESAIARAQTRLSVEAPFETDNQKLIEDV